MANNNLLIIGAGIYGLVAKEIADSMQRFDKIDFIDDGKTFTSNGLKVVGKVNEVPSFINEYNNVVVAIGNCEVRLSILNKLKELPCKIVALISPSAYVSPSAEIGEGCIIEPMAVVHTGVKLSSGCIVSAGAVVNHASVLLECVHVDCNATVKGGVTVPAQTKVESGKVF